MREGEGARRDDVEDREGIGGRALGPLVFGLITSALLASRSAIDGNALPAALMGLLAIWIGWRMSYCGIVVTREALELRNLLRTTCVRRPCRGRAYSTLFGSLALALEGRRRIVARSVAQNRLIPRFRDSQVADVLERCGIDVSEIR